VSALRRSTKLMSWTRISEPIRSLPENTGSCTTCSGPWRRFTTEWSCSEVPTGGLQPSERG
jgi:hypothetical protein